MKVEDLNGLARQVYRIAEADEKARQNDKYLVWKFHCQQYQRQHGKAFPLSFSEFNSLTSSDSITRVRRKLQEDKLIPANKKAQTDRHKKQRQVRDWSRNQLLF